MRDSGGKDARSDLLGGAGWVLFGLLVGAESLRMERFTQMGATLYTMPGFMPGMISVTLVLLGALLCLRGWRRGVAAGHATADVSQLRLFNTRVAATLALALLYAVGLIGRTHFLLATTFFVTAFVWLFAPPQTRTARRTIVALVAGLGTALAVFTLFEDLFLVRLP